MKLLLTFLPLLFPAQQSGAPCVECDAVVLQGGIPSWDCGSGGFDGCEANDDSCSQWGFTCQEIYPPETPTSRLR